jgi:ketosteroid isomerase-like protein
MKADANIRGEISKRMRAMWRAYGQRDVEEVLAFYAPDADMLAIGSGSDEIYVGLKQARKGLKRDFSQTESVEVKLSKVRISAAGKVAWLAANCLFMARMAGGEIAMDGILTTVLEKRKG